MMMKEYLGRGKIIIWQVLFLVLGTTWLLAPALNHALSYRSSLISQYETSGQPYALLFRIGDLLAGALVVWLAAKYFRRDQDRAARLLILVIGIGLMLDPILATTCQVQGMVCKENFSFNFFLHAIETSITAMAFIVLAVYDAKRRKKLVSILFVVFQVAYGLLFLSQLASSEHFNTASQYVYQCALMVWLAWLCRDYLAQGSSTDISSRETAAVRYAVAAWAILNGLLSIVISLAHIHLFGKIRGLYFAGDNAWLAQHGVIIGVITLYLSRHILRGEMRARQIFLVITGLEVLKYSVVTPSVPLVMIYAATFCLLFVTVDEFRRGVIPMTWQVRARDLVFMVGALLTAAFLALLVLDRDNRVSRITSRSFDNFSDYALHADKFHHTHMESILLANTATAFLIVSAGAILWILFRPYKSETAPAQDFGKVRTALNRYSKSSEDYFKLWPPDKQYFWDKKGQGFIAYKVVGPVAFALADPIAPEDQRPELLSQFVEWTQSRRLRACFLPVFESSLNLYEAIGNLQIGASALIDTGKFIDDTSTDKWWRWKRNRAAKQGYQYAVSRPPHSPGFMRSIREVSNSWLAAGGHEERQFALGYFDEAYLQQCDIHYLQNQAGEILAFTNQLPAFNNPETTTIDLLRYTPDAHDAMPFLLYNVISSCRPDYKYFDLGFVPFATTKGPIQSIARTLSAGRFSAKGLEQFKNKFDPDWQLNFLAYDGDLADLALIALHLENAMKLD